MKLNLHERARKGDISILNEPGVTEPGENVNLYTPLHYLAGEGCIEVLQHPEATTLRDFMGRAPIHWLAISNMAMLDHPEVDVVRDANGWTPLHWMVTSQAQDPRGSIGHPLISIFKGVELTGPLAWITQTHKNNERVLAHPSVGTIKNKNGLTPLHLLAEEGCVAALSHPEASTIVDNRGMTALHWFAFAYEKHKRSANYFLEKCCEELMNHPLAKTPRNIDGKNPFELLAQRGHTTAKWSLERETMKKEGIIYKETKRIGRIYTEKRIYENEEKLP